MTRMAEEIVASIPFSDLISNKPIKLTKSNIKAATNLNKGLDNSIRDFIVSDKSLSSPKSSIKMADFSNIKKSLDEIDINQLVTVKLAGIPEDQVDDVSILLTNILQYLKLIMPVNRSETIFGIDDRAPSDYEVSKFLRAIRVLDDPAIVVDLMRAGTLTGTEIEALAAMYPELLDSVKASVVEALIDVKSKLPSATLGRQKNAILSTVLQIPRLTPAALQQLQGSYQDKEPASSPAVAEATQTETQRVQFA